jgi:NAD(P)-dependent dehydrogenase (short-subunit alcohol dehydrogenase family)
MSDAVSLETGPVLITGAARRIGLAIAERFAREGRPVVLHSSRRSLAEAQVAVEAINANGGYAQALEAELSNIDETTALVAAAEQAFGPITLLVNNASLFTPDDAGDFALELYERHFAINLRAPLLLSKEMAARLPVGADGAIVNIIDQRVWRLTPRYFSYTLSKSALWTATQTMAQAFAPRVRVNAVGPGPVLPNAAFGDKGFVRETLGVPLQRAVGVENVVDAVSYLAKARCVTGQMIAVDSGQHLSWRTPDALSDE